MLKYEKKAFWKFFSIYFGTVALLILASGYFYFEEQKKTFLQKEHFSMIEYVRKVKMKQTPSNSVISYKIIDIELPDFSMDNFEIQEDKFMKYMPYSWKGGYLLVEKDKSVYHANLRNVKLKIISIQLILLFLFAIISYFLSVRALRPMQEAITKLDNFSKDLIHDLNTPVTSILLNIKLLNKQSDFSESKPINRIKKSVEDISALHNNLTLLLQEKTMLIQKENISDIVYEVVSTQQRIYSDIHFSIEVNNFRVSINKNAFKQVLVNIVSNACKYNKKNGSIRIYTEDKALHIQDRGIGIRNPSEVFERSYKEHTSGHGIGLDITKRLCDAMDIEISVKSEIDKGSRFSLIFK